MRLRRSLPVTVLMPAVAVIMLLAVACGGGEPTAAPAPAAPAASTQPAAPAPATAEAPDPYYRGKTIRLLVNWPPGSSADLFARLIARHYRRFIEGEPKLVVLNKAGASGLVGALSVYRAKPNGLTLGVFTGVNPGRQLAQQGVRYDLLKFRAIGGLQRRTATWEVTQDAPYRRLQDAIGKGSDPNAPIMTVASETACTSTTLRLRALKEWLDLPIDIKLGLPGGRVPSMQQIEQNVVHSVHSAFWYTVPRDRPGWYKDKFIEPFAIVSLNDTPFPPNEEISMPADSHYIEDLLPDDKKDLYRKISDDLGPMYRVFLAPPGTPVWLHE